VVSIYFPHSVFSQENRRYILSGGNETNQERLGIPETEGSNKGGTGISQNSNYTEFKNNLSRETHKNKRLQESYPQEKGKEELIDCLRCQQTFLVKESINTLGFESHLVSVTTNSILHCSTKAATDNKQMNEHGCVPIKLYLQKTGRGKDLAPGP